MKHYKRFFYLFFINFAALKNREVFLEFDDDEREVTIIEEMSTPKPKLSHKDKKREKKMQKMREKADRARLKKEGPRVISNKKISLNKELIIYFSNRG